MPATSLNEMDLVELLYQDKAGKLTVNSDILDQYVTGCHALGQEPAFSKAELPNTVEEAIKQWNIPADIASLDLDIYFAEKISTIEEAVRVAEELELFRNRGLEPMLRFMIYLVRVMKEHKIVWGVGRGSSVSSFLLYLVGLHQINPVKYNLDIKEFIR
jgi:DNA polymerase III alpha subunit